jgi:hypothetical protein
MRTDFSHLEQFRHTKLGEPLATKERDHFGAFFVPYGKIGFVIIVSDGAEEGPGKGWEHVSARVKGTNEKNDRCPTWEEMCWIKQLFWEDEECVIQYHPPRSEYVNNHSFVLHLWKRTDSEFLRPPSILVGLK